MQKVRLAAVLSAFFAFILVSACSVAESKTAQVAARPDALRTNAGEAKAASIKVEPNGPADIVRIFYSHLRDKRFREAIYLTNLRPAIEQLSDTELKDYEVDLSAVARHVPSDIVINGEIITGDKATVTAKLPGDDVDKVDLQELNLRKENGNWIIITVDEAAEKRIKEAGKNYLRILRIETHQDEAREMLNRIAKAQIAFATQNGGKFGNIRSLVGGSLLPNDVLSAESTGYIYAVTLTDGARKYYATATPAEYGKSGLMSFIVKLSDKNSPLLSSKDTGGKPMQK
ncbi:MAG TPA: hypothetical protein VL572_11120 [Pyrinomonadaceae bacterium]|nr:hypothetical protein [Pyrinomonadaceae bacterium]